MTDVERATALAHAVAGDAGTNELVALLAQAFAQVRAEERQRTLDDIARSVRVTATQTSDWAEERGAPGGA